MEKVGFNELQQVIFDEFSQDKVLRERFYFTGGTALSVFYLQHRLSDDMDFFSEKDFDNELVFPFVKNVAQKLGFQERFTQKEGVRMFRLVEGDEDVTKIDFVHYPYPRVREGQKVQGVVVDSFLDMAINKFLTINQRTDVKDFVDLYFIKDKLSIWDLMEGVRQKFGFELDPILIAADFMKVEEFDFLPKMILPLTVSELQNYFKQKAREVSDKFLV